jgi:hypothetical protein
MRDPSGSQLKRANGSQCEVDYELVAIDPVVWSFVLHFPFEQDENLGGCTLSRVLY